MTNNVRASSGSSFNVIKVYRHAWSGKGLKENTFVVLFELDGGLYKHSIEANDELRAMVEVRKIFNKGEM